MLETSVRHQSDSYSPYYFTSHKPQFYSSVKCAQCYLPDLQYGSKEHNRCTTFENNCVFFFLIFNRRSKYSKAKQEADEEKHLNQGTKIGLNFRACLMFSV